MAADGSGTTSWDMVRERLANPEFQRTSWLATTRPNGRPHLMPVIATWIDDAIHLIVGEGTRKGRNLARDPRWRMSEGQWRHVFRECLERPDRSHLVRAAADRRRGRDRAWAGGSTRR